MQLGFEPSLRNLPSEYVSADLSENGIEQSVEVFSETAQRVSNTAKQALSDLHVARVFLGRFRQHRPQLKTNRIYRVTQNWKRVHFC